MKLNERILQKRFYLDGAQGSQFIKLGIDTKNCERLNLGNPEVVKNLHNSYIYAGSNMVYTNTFGCNGLNYTRKNELKDIITAGIDIANNCIKDREDSYVAYDCGPLNELLKPFGELSFEEAYDLYKQQALFIKDSLIDCVVLETFTDIHMLKAAILAFKENTDFPIWCSMSFNENGRTFNGSGISSFALIAQGLNVDCIGINCSLGPDKTLNNVKELIKWCHIPVFVKPNAGLPLFKNGRTYYDINAEQFSDYMVKIAETGVSILGGCCGTDKEYIRKTVLKTENLPFKLSNNDVDAVCSYSKIVSMDKHVVIGERVNPTGKPLLKQALIEDNFDFIKSMCSEQINKGADILDINVGMSGIDETSKLKDVIINIQGVADVPLELDSNRVSALEEALRIINGIPIINSVNADDESLDSILPLAKKYGAYIIGLCLNKSGIPETQEKRIELAIKIIDKALSYGIPRFKILIDPLTMAVSVNDFNAVITLNTLKEIKEKLKVKVVLGLSNVSYGLPNREIINSTFYKMAKDVGLDAVIINPAVKPITNEFAEKMLKGEDFQCKNYISAFSDSNIIKQKTEINIKSIEECIVNGLKSEGLEIVKNKVNKDNYIDLINIDIIGSLNRLGSFYEQGKAFLPQLIAGAEVAKVMLDFIKENYISEGNNKGAVMLMATVKGDVHDIGKNIVKAVLSNYGFNIIDLGKNVETEVIIDAIKKYNPSIIGLSALMTTTLDNMKNSIMEIKRFNSEIKIIIGGAVVTQQFADEMGVLYAKDAQDAVKKLK